MARIPDLQAGIPYRLTRARQTGVCIPPGAVTSVLALMDDWPQPIMPHPMYGAPTPGEIQAFREALLYARNHQAGLWEAASMLQPEDGIFPQILSRQWEREEHPEQFTEQAMAEQVTTVRMAAEMSPESAKTATEFANSWAKRQTREDLNADDTQSIDDEEEAPQEAPKKSWLGKLFKR